MMGNIFLVSDTHFGHKGVTQFLKEDGTKLRPWDSVEEMDEAMVKLWNETVKPTDKVYHLGDVVINRRALGILSRLNGDKGPVAVRAGRIGDGAEGDVGTADRDRSQTRVL